MDVNGEIKFLWKFKKKKKFEGGGGRGRGVGAQGWGVQSGVVVGEVGVARFGVGR